MLGILKGDAVFWKATVSYHNDSLMLVSQSRLMQALDLLGFCLWGCHNYANFRRRTDLTHSSVDVICLRKKTIEQWHAIHNRVSKAKLTGINVNKRQGKMLFFSLPPYFVDLCAEPVATFLINATPGTVISLLIKFSDKTDYSLSLLLWHPHPPNPLEPCISTPTSSGYQGCCGRTKHHLLIAVYPTLVIRQQLLLTCKSSILTLAVYNPILVT